MTKAAYGYMRLLGDMTSVDVERISHEMEDYGKLFDFDVFRVFVVEDPEEADDVWCDLMMACYSLQIHDVFVPCMDVFGAGDLAKQHCKRMARRIDGRVWIMQGDAVVSS